jgi:ferredoxin
MYLTIEDRDGHRNLLGLPDLTTQNLMQVLKDNGYPVLAICQGKKTCPTCHIRIRTGQQKLPPISEREKEMLKVLPQYLDDSRIACQIAVTSQLNGLIIKLVRR